MRADRDGRRARTDRPAVTPATSLKPLAEDVRALRRSLERAAPWLRAFALALAAAALLAAGWAVAELPRGIPSLPAAGEGSTLPK